jgi:hypothetical protein
VLSAKPLFTYEVVLAPNGCKARKTSTAPGFALDVETIFIRRIVRPRQLKTGRVYAALSNYYRTDGKKENQEFGNDVTHGKPP